MDTSLVQLIAVIGLTVIGLLIVVIIVRRAQPRATVAWVGLTLIPLGVYLAGLMPATMATVATLIAWWGALTYTVQEVIGLSLLGGALILLLMSRIVPHRKPKTPAAKTALPLVTPPPSAPEPTRVLPGDQ